MKKVYTLTLCQLINKNKLITFWKSFPDFERKAQTKDEKDSFHFVVRQEVEEKDEA